MSTREGDTCVPARLPGALFEVLRDDSEVVKKLAQVRTQCFPPMQGELEEAVSRLRELVTGGAPLSMIDCINAAGWLEVELQHAKEGFPEWMRNGITSNRKVSPPFTLAPCLVVGP